MSLKAGGVGINLTAASNAFVLVSATLQLPLSNLDYFCLTISTKKFV